MTLSVFSPFPNISTSHEKNVPALPKASCPPIRFSSPHAHQGRSRHPGSPPGEGSRSSGWCRNRTQVCPPHRSLSSPVGFSAQAHSESGPVSSQKLPRTRIIRRRTIFDATRLKGRRVNNRWMALNFLPLDPAQPDAATVAFLTPKRLGAATKRNQLRRRMREICRRYLAKPSEDSYLVWVARPTALELDFEGLKKCMAQLRHKMDHPL
jgi:ribonuclease P protein component